MTDNGVEKARDNGAGEGEFAELDTGDAVLADVSARAAAHGAAVANAFDGRVLRELLELLLGGVEFFVGGRRVGEDGFQLGALGTEFLGELDALFVTLDGGRFWHGESELN